MTRFALQSVRTPRATVRSMQGVNPNDLTVVVLDLSPSPDGGLAPMLQTAGWRVVVAGSDSELEQLAAEEQPNLVVLGLHAHRVDVAGRIQHLRLRWPEADIILCAERPAVADAVRALHAGARDFLERPVNPAALQEAVRQAALASQERVTLNPRPRRSPRRRPASHVFVGTSPRMRRIAETVAEIAPTRVPVLVSGESGTGKELVAHALHERSDRRAGPFIALNCAGLTDTLIESELFGHVRGAFTGAIADRPGAFQLAAGGTLFLDEIGDLSAKGQGDLLRVLEDGVFRPVGGSQPQRADVRIVAASHRDLLRRAAEGRFRDDLLYRLNIVELHLPPLRERPEDIPALVDAFNAHFATRHGRRRKTFTPGFLAWLARQPWPGNIRELRNLIERLVLTARPTQIDESWLPPPPVVVTEPGAEVLFEVRAGESLPELEMKLIRATLARVTSHRRDAARILGISPRALAYKIKAMRQQPAANPPPLLRPAFKRHEA